MAADRPPEEVLAQRDLLLSVNLMHTRAHRHAALVHMYPHVHGR